VGDSKVTESEVVGRTATIRGAIYNRESFHPDAKVRYLHRNIFEKSDRNFLKVLRK
jgi:hypothetical protein